MGKKYKADKISIGGHTLDESRMVILDNLIEGGLHSEAGYISSFTDTNTHLTDAEIAAMGYIKTYTDTNTQLSQAQVGAYAVDEGFIKTYTDTNTQLTSAQIAEMGYTSNTGTVTTVGVTVGVGISVSIANRTTEPQITLTNTGYYFQGANTGYVGSGGMQNWNTQESTPSLNPTTDWFTSLRIGHGHPVDYYSNTLGIQMTGGDSGRIYTRTITGGSAGSWKKYYHTGDFSTADVAKGVTAHGWSNHADAGYLTALPSHNHDDRYYTEAESNSRFINVTGDTMSGSLDVNADIQANTFTQAAHGIPRNNLGAPTVTEMALFDNQFTPKTTLANNYDDLTDLTFWVQTTSSSAWTEITTFSDDQKRKFLRTNNSNIAIPNGVYKLRVEFVGKGYTFANAMYAYWSSNSHNTQVHVWKYNVNSSSWLQHTNSSATISSWPGHMYLPFSTIPWLESATTHTGHFKSVRIEFTPTWSTGTYSDRVINLYGMQVWGGYPSGRRTPHYYDQNGRLNVTKELSVSDNIRTPLLYDLNNTSYYLDPASTSNLNVINATGGTSTEWNTAHGWGNHADEGYLTSYTDTNTTYDNTDFVDLTSAQTVGGIKTFTSDMVIKNGDPTLGFADTDANNDDFYIHVNSNNFYVLADRDDSGLNNGISGWDGSHPLQLESDTNKAYTFGNEIYHTGNLPTIPSGNSTIDWTTDQGGTNIHSGNYTNTDTNTQLTTAQIAAMGYIKENEDRRHKVLRFTGEGTNSNNSAINYGIYQAGGAWSSPFPDLVIAMHTGIKIGGYPTYGGTRFYSDAPERSGAVELMSVGNGNANVNITNSLTVGGTVTASGTTSLNWKEAYGWGNHADAGYTGDQDLSGYFPKSGGSLTGSANITGATADFTTVSSWNLAAKAGDGNGYSFWGTGTSYKISMGNSSIYHYGDVPGYSIKTQMDSGSTDRGFTWGRVGAVPIASLNSTSGIFTTEGAIKAPVFYDSNNTGYYLNPSSTSNLNIVQAVQFQGSLAGTASNANTLDSFSSESFLRSDADDTVNAGVTYTWTRTDTAGIVFVNNTYNTQLAMGGWTTTNSNNISRIRTSSGNLHIDSAANGNTYLNWYSGGDIKTNSLLQSDASLRAPIFYDSNNTSYYVDPNSRSRFNEIQTSDSGAAPRYDTAFYVIQGQHWYGDTGSQVMYIGESGSPVRLRGNLRIGGNANADSGMKLTVDGSSNATSSFRAPIFYDSNDTTYYTNPAGASIVKQVKLVNSSTPLVLKVNSSYKSWVHHIASNDSYVFAPSTADGGESWDWANQMSISSSGVVTANNFVLSSDERKKTKIKDLPRNNINTNWKSFEMKNDEGEYRTGVIAQELEETHPEFVNTDPEGFKSVKYIDLLIAKIAELEARLEKLEK